MSLRVNNGLESQEALLEDSENNSIPMQDGASKPNASKSKPKGRPLRRFILRGLVAIFIPPAILAYYLVIWYYYLNASPSSSPVFFGPHGGLWVFYSWFLIGVIGLNLSSYGFEAVEATMMMTPTWSVDNAMLVMMHGDHSWSGPGGWWKIIQSIVLCNANKQSGTIPSKLWTLLATLSLLAFIGIPLSGLAMNPGDGFVSTKQSPTVTGFTYENFNDRKSDNLINGAGLTWQNNFGGKVPGMGVIYTQPEVDRTNEKLSFLQDLPSSLPIDDGITKMFLIPQAELPVKGKSWGLALQYNCSIVTDVADFTILNHRNASEHVHSQSNSFTYLNANNDSISIYNQTNRNLPTAWAQNYEAVLEMGQSKGPKFSGSQYVEGPSTNCYFTAQPNITERYPGLNDTENVFEAILWQTILTFTERFDPKPVFNASLESTIKSLNGAHSSSSNQSMAAIGLRCLSSSSVGTADIDGMHATFTNFQATDTPVQNQTAACTIRFGSFSIHYMIEMMINKFTQTASSDFMWIQTFFNSISAQPPFYAQEASGAVDAGFGTPTQLSLLQAVDFRSSILRAYSAYAVQLMYNGGQGYSAVDGTHGLTFTNKNLTAYKADNVLQGGPVKPIIPAILLAIWALGSVILGCWYGFRQRWAATLDGYGLFVFGVDLAEEVNAKGDLSATLDFENSRVLKKLPGLIGDRDRESDVGRIGLVADKEAVVKRGRNYL